MAELADAPDLGSGVPDVKVQVLSPVPKKKTPKGVFFLWYSIKQGLEWELLISINSSKKVIYNR